MNALKVTNVSKTYRSRRGEIRALDGVSFAVPERGIFGLLGMNGAGKSTAVKICTGMAVADDGVVEVFGRDIVRERAACLPLIGCSPQDTAVAPLLSVRENLIFTARIYGDGKADAARKADDIMARLMLSDRADERAQKLSGGLMRRLSIGMALISSPRLVFLDEPSLGLDVLARRELWRYVRALAENAAVVLTTHYLEEAEALCERVAVLAHGKIVADGAPVALIEQSGASDFEDAFIKLSGGDCG